MRVLYVAHSVNKDGSTTALLNLLESLRDMGVEVGATIPYKGGYLYEKLCLLNIPVFYRRGYPSIIAYPSIRMGLKQKISWFYNYSKIIIGVQKDLFRIIREFKPDIVHTNSSAIDYALLGCFLTKTPHVWHIRELLVEGCNIKVFPCFWFFKWKMKLPFSHSIAVTHAVYDYYKMTNKDIVIYDGVLKKNEKIIPSSDFPYPFFITVGYVYEAKGTLNIIKQFAQFAQNNKNIHLIVVGGYDKNGQYFQNCKKAVHASNIEDRVHFLGQREDVYALMASAKALLVASRFEGFGFTPVEAMFCNTLVIGRDIGGIKEQFDLGLKQTGSEIGLRFNEDEVLPVLMDRAASEDFTDMITRAKEVVLNNYTMAKNADNVLSFYRKIVG